MRNTTTPWKGNGLVGAKPKIGSIGAFGFAARRRRSTASSV